jgi:hypothetical protein
MTKVKTKIQLNGCVGTPVDNLHNSELFIVDVKSTFNNSVNFAQSSSFSIAANFEDSIFSTKFITASLGFSGSLTRLANGNSYLVAGTNITITSQSNGSIIIDAVSNSSASSLTPQLITTNTTMSADSLNTRVLFVSTSNSNIGIEIPNNPSTGTSFFVKRIDSALSNSVTVRSTGGTLIDGELSQTISSQYTSIHFIFYNSAWWII